MFGIAGLLVGAGNAELGGGVQADQFQSLLEGGDGG